MQNKQKRCIIFSSDDTKQIWVEVLPESLVETCQDIWDHPSKYSDYQDRSEDAYYRFLKFLWVRYPEGKEVRLGDLVNT
jgi:hypothetical protein